MWRSGVSGLRAFVLVAENAGTPKPQGRELHILGFEVHPRP